ncbi:hypothetical protein Lfu02_66690 [Longispora fulva]|nr:hypothetical protein Lfu02_66690 [Longispora fulva]
MDDMWRAAFRVGFEGPETLPAPGTEPRHRAGNGNRVTAPVGLALACVVGLLVDGRLPLDGSTGSPLSATGEGSGATARSWPQAVAPSLLSEFLNRKIKEVKFWVL